MCPDLAPGAPVIAHSTGSYPAGVAESNTCGLGGCLSVASSPEGKSQKFDEMFQDAQTPISRVRTPCSPETKLDSPEPSVPDPAEVLRSKALPDSDSMPPPPVPSGGNDPKDALYWKFSSWIISQFKTVSWGLTLVVMVRPQTCHIELMSGYGGIVSSRRTKLL